MRFLRRDGWREGAMPECLHAEEELCDEVVIMAEELLWIVEEQLRMGFI